MARHAPPDAGCPASSRPAEDTESCGDRAVNNAAAIGERQRLAVQMIKTFITGSQGRRSRRCALLNGHIVELERRVQRHEEPTCHRRSTWGTGGARNGFRLRAAPARWHEPACRRAVARDIHGDHGTCVAGTAGGVMPGAPGHCTMVWAGITIGSSSSARIGMSVPSKA